MQCEGWRRFTFGPVKWSHCTDDAIVTLTVTQDEETEEMPACQRCWHEAIENKIKISAAAPFPVAA